MSFTYVYTYKFTYTYMNMHTNYHVSANSLPLIVINGVNFLSFSVHRQSVMLIVNPFY